MRKQFIPYIIAGIFVVLIVGTIVLVINLDGYSTGGSPKLKFTIVGTNDLHGKYYPTLLSRSDTLEKYTFGGLEVMASIIQILRNQNPNYFLYLDAGDQFQGAFQSSKQISSGQIISDYFNHMNLATSAVGNHQFDFGQQYLKNYLSKLRHNVLSANLIDQSFQNTDTKVLPLYQQQPSKIYSFPLSQPYLILTGIPQIKIGLIGLATIETLYTTSGFTDKLFPSSYKFEKYTEIVIQESLKLKKQGVHAIFLVSHVGNNCGRDITYGIWTMENMGNTDQCIKNDQIFSLIDTLPEKAIDAVIQGHRHSTNHFFYKNIPIIGSVNDGNFLNALYLEFILEPKSIKIDPKSIKIEGPIPVCQRVFENTKQCDYVLSEDLPAAGKLVQWQFHGVPVKKDTQLVSIAKSKWGRIMQQYQIQIIPNFIPYQLQKIYTVKNPLGNLITNLLAQYMIKKQYSFDFAVINAGSFRSTWYPGIIRYAQLRSMFPFENLLYFFEIKGSDLKTLISTIQNGKKKFYPTYGLSQVFQKVPGVTTLNLVDLVLSNGSPIIDNQIYRGATNDFLAKGGDDFKTTTSLLSNLNNTNENIRVIIRQQLQSLQSLTEESLKNPTSLQRLTVLD